MSKQNFAVLTLIFTVVLISVLGLVGFILGPYYGNLGVSCGSEGETFVQLLGNDWPFEPGYYPPENVHRPYAISLPAIPLGMTGIQSKTLEWMNTANKCEPDKVEYQIYGMIDTYVSDTPIYLWLKCDSRLNCSSDQ